MIIIDWVFFGAQARLKSFFQIEMPSLGAADDFSFSFLAMAKKFRQQCSIQLLSQEAWLQQHYNLHCLEYPGSLVAA